MAKWGGGARGGKVAGSVVGRPGLFREKLREAPTSSLLLKGSDDQQRRARGAALRRNVGGDVGDDEDGPYAEQAAQFVVPPFHSKKGFNLGVGWI